MSLDAATVKAWYVEEAAKKMQREEDVFEKISQQQQVRSAGVFIRCAPLHTRP